MARKTFTFILSLLCLFSYVANAQGDAGYDWKDSSKIPTKRLPQQTEFLNNNYPYPAKPRSKAELGFSAGNSMIIGDVNPKADLGFGLSLRKAFSHTFSYRLGYFGSYNQGYPSGYQKTLQYRSYQNWSHRAGLDFIASLNTNSAYRGNPKTNIYIFGGVDLIATKVFFADPNGQQIDKAYSIFYGNGIYRAGQPANAQYYNDEIANSKDGSITTFGAKSPAGFTNGRRSWTLLGGASTGAGIAFKLSKKVNIGLEQRFTFTPYDYLDAVKNAGNDIYSYTSARLNLNVGSSSKKVEPLWWLNGNNYVYNEINRPQHMKIPPPVLPDADGDGVTDQFDMEPNTPAGAPVDVRGVAKDTDGDGVPDYKDKELLTSQKCFPVDAEGVGTCPEPACCTEIRTKLNSGEYGTVTDHIQPANCGLSNLPSVQFKVGKNALTTMAVGTLAKIAAQIKSAPDCHIKVVGHGASDKNSQQSSWDKVNSVIRYLVERQGISQDRFIFSYGEEGDVNTVDLSATKEEGPNTVPAPHPNLINKSKKK